MAITKEISVTAIVIGYVDYKESSKIIKLFTKQLGIISAYARGAKRSKSKMHNLTSPFCLAEFSLIKKSDLYYINDGQIITINEELRRDLRDIYSAQLCLELVEKSLFEDQINSDLFDLLNKTIKIMSNCQKKIRLISMFIIKYVSMIGYKPELNTCVECGKIPKHLGFSIIKGGISCLDHHISLTELKSKEHKYLLWLLYSKLDLVDELEFDVDEKKINKMLIDFAIEQTGMRKPTVLEAFSKFMLNWLDHAIFIY